MSADDQAFLDTLSSVPNEIRRYSNEVADYVDKQLDHVSIILREALASSPWIPESARPRPPPPPPKSFIQSVTPSRSTYARIQDWVLKNKTFTAVIVLTIGGISYYVIKKRSHRKKRRAKRAGNGARVEVVVLAGSPSEPITRSISLDLERRGFIVYIVCNTIEEEIIVQNESRPDIKPLMVDIVNPDNARASIERFRLHLLSPHTAFEGARPHHLALRSVILIPSPTYSSSPIATLPPSTLSDLLNTRLLTPILTLQTFLPLLASTETSVSASLSEPSVLILTPSIIASLRPGFHLPECLSVAGLSSFTDVLRAELAPLSIPVTQLQLGSFDVRHFSPHHRQITPQAQRAETLRWEDEARLAWGRNFVSSSTKEVSFGRGSTLRVLNDAVFDAMARRSGGVVRVGVGSSIYGFVGQWVPRSLVGWMMGVRKVERDPAEFGNGTGMEVMVSGRASRESSPGSHGSSVGYGDKNPGIDGSEYISVLGEKGFEIGREDEG